MPSSDYHEAVWAGVAMGQVPHDFARRRAFLLAAVRPGDRVLDLGCGEGAFAAELVRAGAHVVAVDVADEPLRRAREHGPELDLRRIEPDGPWDLPDGGFDVVWAGEVVEHVADTAAWLSEVRRVLRSGGTLLISTPSHGPLRLLGLALRPRAAAAHFDPRGDHLRFYTRSSLRNLLEDLRFEDVRIDAVGGRPGARQTLLARAVRARW